MPAGITTAILCSFAALVYGCFSMRPKKPSNYRR